MIDFSKFSFRAHYIGELMTEPKEKSNKEKYETLLESSATKLKKLNECSATALKTKAKLEAELDKINDQTEALRPFINQVNLSETCKTRLAKIFTEADSGRVKDIRAKYLEKGLRTEEDIIDMYSELMGKMYRKNKFRLDNGNFNGEFDFEDADMDMIIDAKSAWDIFSFDNNLTKSLNPIYYWQGQVYMLLKKRAHHRVVYGLANTPKNMVEIEMKKLLYDFVGTPEDLQEAYSELEAFHNYDSMPLKRKLKIFDIDRNEEDIAKMESMVPHWRNYLSELQEKAYKL